MDLLVLAEGVHDRVEVVEGLRMAGRIPKTGFFKALGVDEHLPHDTLDKELKAAYGRQDTVLHRLLSRSNTSLECSDWLNRSPKRYFQLDN